MSAETPHDRRSSGRAFGTPLTVNVRLHTGPHLSMLSASIDTCTGNRGHDQTVFGEGRGFRVVWLLEEMGLPYKLRPVDLLAGVEHDAEFLAINPSGFIPAIQDGDVTMVESVAIMEYLMARYGPTPLAPDPHDPAFPAYQQFLTSAKPASPPRFTSSP